MQGIICPPRRRGGALAVLCLALILGGASLASAFTSGPHPPAPARSAEARRGRLQRAAGGLVRGQNSRTLRMVARGQQPGFAAPAAASPGTGPPPGQLVRYYDTTLRDGAQGEGISLSCDDKLRIAARLTRFGADYIEAGWPGSNPKDAEFFERAQGELSAEAWSKVVAFGSTRYKDIAVEDDKQVQMLVDSKARVVTLVGKSWDLHVDEVLETSREENLAMIRDTVRYLHDKGIEVMLDAEHFYDGYRANPSYAIECLAAAVEGQVDWLVLCDTNGGSLPWDIEDITRIVADKFPETKIGIHCHNDQGMAVANSLAAVRGGASLIQGTVNGYGERTGNANIISILPTLALSMQLPSSVREPMLAGLTSLSRYVDEQANQPSKPEAAFVGGACFGSSPCFPGGSPASDPVEYRVRPTAVGNGFSTAPAGGMVEGEDDASPVLISNETVRSLLRYGGEEEVVANATRVMRTVRALSQKGYFFEGADASVDLMLRRALAAYRPPFEVLDYNVMVSDEGKVMVSDEGNVMVSDEGSADGPGKDASDGGQRQARATVKLRVDQEVVNRYVVKELRKLGDLASDAANLATLAAAMASSDTAGGSPGTELLEVAEGNGPVNALGKCLVKALLPLFPPLEYVELSDYKVRILDNEAATGAVPRVMIEFIDTQTGSRWTTAAADSNIVTASMNALVDGIEYMLEHRSTFVEREN